MIKVQIVSATVRDFKGVSTKSGSPKPYHMRFQTAYAFPVLPDTGEISPLPDKFELQLETEQAPYAPGVYDLLPSSLQVSRDGRLECSPRLAPVPARKA